jgi:hypothetical protein
LKCHLEISDDFMDELKKRITGHSHRKANELHLLMPENKRNREIEQVIIRRYSFCLCVSGIPGSDLTLLFFFV